MDKIIELINQYSAFIIIGLALITFLLLIITIILLASVSKLKKRYRKMMRGVNNKNLEEVINLNLDNIEKAMNSSQDAINEYKRCR